MYDLIKNSILRYNKENGIRRKAGQRKRLVTDHNSTGEITSDPWEGAILTPGL